VEIYKKILKLNLPFYKYDIIKKNDKLFIKDIIKSKYLILTPEEWVRQHFINFLITEKKVPAKLIRTESKLVYNKMTKRTDILVYAQEGHQLLLIECKASHIKLNEKTVFQLSIYNAKLKTPFIAITNGIQHYFWHKINENEYARLKELPDYGEMNKYYT